MKMIDVSITNVEVTSHTCCEEAGCGKNQTLRKMTSELDSELGAINCRIETLTDIKTELLQLVDQMNIAAYNNKLHLYCQENHRKIRILSELMCYSMNELTKNFETAYGFHQSMFEKIMDNEEVKTNEHGCFRII
jgi:cell division protein ZapA (FtsZ GTPase activity inhibitor)